MIPFWPLQTPQTHGVPDPIPGCGWALIDQRLEETDCPSFFSKEAATKFSFTLEEFFPVTLLSPLLFLPHCLRMGRTVRVWGIWGARALLRAPGEATSPRVAHHTCSCAAPWVTLRCWSVPFSLRVPKGFLQPTPPPPTQLRLPILGSERSWAGGKGKVGGDGLEEIEHSLSGLNGRVSLGASGCQMMDGMDTILHPREHRAPAPSPQPPTSIPPSSLQSTFLHSGLGTPAATQGGGGDSRAALLSLGLTLALIPSLAALRSENSWAPGDKDQSLRGMCVCAQEKGERIQQFLPWGKRECPPSHTHTHHKVDQTASLEKRRKKEGGCKQKCPFL